MHSTGAYHIGDFRSPGTVGRPREPAECRRRKGGLQIKDLTLHPAPSHVEKLYTSHAEFPGSARRDNAWRRPDRIAVAFQARPGRFNGTTPSTAALPTAAGINPPHRKPPPPRTPPARLVGVNSVNSNGSSTSSGAGLA